MFLRSFSKLWEGGRPLLPELGEKHIEKLSEVLGGSSFSEVFSKNNLYFFVGVCEGVLCDVEVLQRIREKVGGEADIFPQRVELHAPDWENGWRKAVRESTAIIENFPQHTHKHIHI
jgi:hypothetical protein